jgi:hypothetical protein
VITEGGSKHSDRQEEAKSILHSVWLPTETSAAQERRYGSRNALSPWPPLSALKKGTSTNPILAPKNSSYKDVKRWRVVGSKWFSIKFGHYPPFRVYFIHTTFREFFLLPSSRDWFWLHCYQCAASHNSNGPNTSGKCVFVCVCVFQTF